ncbi:recombination mediator RecR [Spirochaetota bacterium]
MNNPSKYLESLVKEFSKLPGIGVKTASRLAFHMLDLASGEVEKLARSMIELKENIKHCLKCGGISDEDICTICSDDSRDSATICVVEHARDILTIENTGEYKGIYHVLMGVISPLDGIGPEDLNIASLIDRCKENKVGEVILAIGPRIEGDATSLYLARILEELSINVSRIAHGLPVGSDLEFADSATIIKSIEGRVKI